MATGGDRLHRPFLTGLLGALFLVGAVVTVIVTDRAVSVRDERDLAASRSVAAEVAASLEATVASVSGTDAMGVDGDVTAIEFAAYADNVLTGGTFSALAFADIVPGALRPAWEADTGIEIADTDGAGGLVEAAPREEHLPVRMVQPETPEAMAVLGFDLASDAVRLRGATEARASDRPVLVGPIPLARTGLPGVFVVHDVHGPTGAAIGLVASGITLQPLIDGITGSNAFADVGTVALAIDGAPLVDGPTAGPRTDVEIGGRVFTVWADDRRDISWALSLVCAIGTVLLALATLASRRRDAAERSRTDEVARRAIAVNDLTTTLAASDTIEATVTVGASLAKAVLGASHANIATFVGADRTKLLVGHDESMHAALGHKYSLQSMDDALPLTDCVRAGATVAILDREAYAREYPGVRADIEAAGIHAVLCVPVTAERGEAIGAVGYAWDRPLDARERADLEAAAATTALVIGRALERAMVREASRDHAERLSTFASSLATAQTPDEVSAAVTAQLPALLGATAVGIVGHDDPATTTLTYPLASSAETSLAVEPGEGRAWTASDDAIARTVAQLVDAAWARARQHQQEHAVLARLQATLLTPAPPVPGLDVAVGYESALDTVGIGGDWYSVIDRPEATYLAIGDIAGHGPEAVAVMAELKSVMRHLLTAGAPMQEVLGHADAALRRRATVASVVVACVEKQAPRLSYINAGHPYPIVMHHGRRAEPLERTHRPLIGIPVEQPSASVVEFGPGDLFLLYTDGLVEMRDRPLTDSIDELAAELGTMANGSCQDTIEALVRARTRRRSDGPRPIDDDIAVIAVRRLDRPGTHHPDRD